MSLQKIRNVLLISMEHGRLSRMRYAALAILLLFLAPSVSAQKQNNVWYFGHGLGLDFNTSPPTPLYDGGFKAEEGTASVADRTTGELLFYTDGMNIWNRERMVMENGRNLGGHRSSTQSALIIPVPGDDFRYYVFTNGPMESAINPQDGMITRVQYAIVDMRLDNGKGMVVARDITLLDSTTERMHAVALKGGREFWLVTHYWGNDVFCAIRINESGIGQPVLSSSGPKIQQLISSIGCLKLSRHGRYLAIAQYDGIHAHLFDFDTATGIVSNPLALDTRTSGYGVCFSPDESKLYCGGGKLVQYDLRSRDSATIRASRYGLDSLGPFYGMLTLGPDNRIYCAEWGRPYLGVIQYPNAPGARCRMLWDPLESTCRHASLSIL